MIVLKQNRAYVFSVLLIIFQLCCSTVSLAKSFDGSINTYSKKFALLVAEEKRVLQQLRKSPNNTDLLIKMAKIKAKAGRYKDAVWYLHKAQKISPGYEDLYLLEAMMLSELNNRFSCEHKPVFENKYKALASRAHRNRIRQILDSSNRSYTQLETGFAYDELSNNRGVWNEYFVNAKYVDCSKNSYYGGHTEVKRYDISDSEIYAGAAIPFTRFSYLMEYRRADRETLLPAESLTGEIRITGVGPIGIVLRYKKQDYINIKNNSSAIGADYYFSDYQLAYSREWNKAESQSQSYDASYIDKVSLNHYWSKLRYVGASFYIGKELNYDGTANPPYSNIRTLVLSGLHPITTSWSVNYSYKLHEQRGYFDQQGIRVGVRLRY